MYYFVNKKMKLWEKVEDAQGCALAEPGGP